MSEQLPSDITGTQDALLFLDYCARFAYQGGGYTPNYMGQIATVMRTLMRRLEDQAVILERMEASKS